ncbi:helix-turn-helix domain-containing protein [Halobacteria archaeon AArc-curdl1]|uniref:Helix-turn-helix domain-containing protein n=1 Tax=Natronosalvus hydrolyticus TaxID=2979988 RepID=A0AAP2Z4M5_9EURY|nr:helix-turn-helix domain-containing protein [Halobacteria archaeon AArc-curdl1]
MVRDPTATESLPTAKEICAALDDPDCREIIRNLEEPMTASELKTSCDIPQSTLYRKLDLLTESTLLEESTEIRRDGHHASKYAIAFEEISLQLDEDNELTVAINRPPQTTDERLASLWSEVREEV